MTSIKQLFALAILCTSVVFGQNIGDLECDLLTACGENVECVEVLVEKLKLQPCLSMLSAEKRSLFSDKRGPARIRNILRDSYRTGRL